MNGDGLDLNDQGASGWLGDGSGSDNPYDAGGSQSVSDLGFPTDGPEVVNYYFPVEVVIAGTLPRAERESIQAELIQSLQDAVNRRIA